MSKPPQDFAASSELIELARKLADWAAPATGTMIYLYGSRVRGDHKPTSDIDLCIEFPTPTSNDTGWWLTNNQEEFATINAAMGTRVEILERNSPIRSDILLAPVVHQDRNVKCVWRKPYAKI